MKSVLALLVAAATPAFDPLTAMPAGGAAPPAVAVLAELSAQRPNRAPVADAGPDAVAGAGEGAELNGAASFDPDGDAIAFHWVQTAGPRVTLEPNAFVANPAFEAPRQAGRALVFELRVADAHGHGSADSVVVTIAAPGEPTGDEGARVHGEVSLARLQRR